MLELNVFELKVFSFSPFTFNVFFFMSGITCSLANTFDVLRSNLPSSIAALINSLAWDQLNIIYLLLDILSEQIFRTAKLCSPLSDTLAFAMNCLQIWLSRKKEQFRNIKQSHTGWYWTIMFCMFLAEHLEKQVVTCTIKGDNDDLSSLHCIYMRRKFLFFFSHA